MVAITFRMHGEVELLWVSGTITQATEIEYSSGLDATVIVSDKARGRFLDVERMVAVEAENTRQGPAGGGNGNGGIERAA